MRLSFAVERYPSLAAIDLMPDGKWLDRLELTLWARDAGTGSGATYTDPGPDTQPRESVRLLATPHVLDASGLKPVGTARFERVE